MSDVVVVELGGFPQTGSNRQRHLALAELAEYVGGVGRPEVLARAGRAWDAAVREFNTVSWRFNRVSQSITLVPGTKTYTLSTDFRGPYRACMLDSNGVEKWQLEWMTYECWLDIYSSGTSGGSSLPDYYTAFNSHNAGLVRFEPWPTGTLTYPTAQLNYFRRIALATGSDDVLNVPMEVDEAVFQLAAAMLLERTKGSDSDDARNMRGQAKALRMECQLEHRDWPELTGWGANG